jgi:hypothetical protein
MSGLSQTVRDDPSGGDSDFDAGPLPDSGGSRGGLRDAQDHRCRELRWGGCRCGAYEVPGKAGVCRLPPGSSSLGAL